MGTEAQRGAGGPGLKLAVASLVLLLLPPPPPPSSTVPRCILRFGEVQVGKRELGPWAQVPCSSHSLLICCVISKSLSFLEAQFSLLRGNVTALLSGLLRRRGEMMWKL